MLFGLVKTGLNNREADENANVGDSNIKLNRYHVVNTY